MQRKFKTDEVWIRNNLFRPIFIRFTSPENKNKLGLIKTELKFR